MDNDLHNTVLPVSDRINLVGMFPKNLHNTLCLLLETGEHLGRKINKFSILITEMFLEENRKIVLIIITPVDY